MVVLIYGAWVASAIYGATEFWREKRGIAYLFIAAAALCATLVVLAALDNRNLKTYDCRPAVDPYSAADVQSCITDHWLPEPYSRFINPG